jgi:hypothetical protein
VVTQSSQTLSYATFSDLFIPQDNIDLNFYKCFLRMWYTTPSTRRLIEENR